jgi:hypothetical protein
MASSMCVSSGTLGYTVIPVLHTSIRSKVRVTIVDDTYDRNSNCVRGVGLKAASISLSSRISPLVLYASPIQMLSAMLDLVTCRG